MHERMNDWMKKSVNELHKSTCVFLLTDFSFQCSAACQPSVWYLYPLVLARFFFFIPRKTLVSVSPVEKMLKFWQGGIFTVAPSVSPFFLSLHKPPVCSGARFFLVSVANKSHDS